MSRRYDSRTTTFSPEGRLYQVEYAMEAIAHAGTVLGILAKDAVVLAAERRVTSKLLEQDTSSEKIYALSGCVRVWCVAGAADMARRRLQVPWQRGGRRTATSSQHGGSSISSSSAGTATCLNGVASLH